jgi:hypothetical protein
VYADPNNNAVHDERRMRASRASAITLLQFGTMVITYDVKNTSGNVLVHPGSA